MLTGLELTFMCLTRSNSSFSALQVLLSHLWEKEKGGKKEKRKKQKQKQNKDGKEGKRKLKRRKGRKEGRRNKERSEAR